MDIISSVRSRSINLKSSNRQAPLTRSNTAEYGSLVWKFDAENQYLPPRLMYWLYSKYTLRVVLGAIMPLFFLSLLPRWADCT